MTRLLNRTRDALAATGPASGSAAA
jgi:hypothetical protein